MTRGWLDRLSNAKKLACFAVGIAACLTLSNAAWPSIPLASVEILSPAFYRILIAGVMVGLSPLVGIVTITSARMTAMRSEGDALGKPDR